MFGPVVPETTISAYVAYTKEAVIVDDILGVGFLLSVAVPILPFTTNHPLPPASPRDTFSFQYNLTLLSVFPTSPITY